MSGIEIQDDFLAIADEQVDEDNGETEGQEEEVVVGPVVDPTGTFNDWKKFREANFATVGFGEKEEDYIPLPFTDEDGYKVLRPNPQVTLPKPIYSTEPARTGLMPFINFTGTDVEMIGAMVQYNIAEQRQQKAFDDEHSEILDLARRQMVPDAYLWKAQWRPGANWTNNPMLKGRSFAMGPTNPTDIMGQIQTSIKGFSIGVNNSVPLWHSGFFVKLRTPTGRQYSELDALIASEKNVFGRATGGAMFTTSRCFLESAILDLFIDCIETTNVENWTPEIIRGLVDNRDIQVISIALQAAKYPTNYPGVEPCVEAEANCRKTREVSYTPMNTLTVDDAKFTTAEIEFLYNRSAKRTVQQILDFQKDASWNTNFLVEISPGTELRLKHPKAVDVQAAGFIWAGSITAACNRVFGDDSPSRNRSNLMSNLVDVETLRRFTPFIEALVINGEDKPVTDEELLGVMNQYSEEPEFVRRLELGVRNFIERDIIAYMATPRHFCPDCERRLSIKDPQRLKDYMEHPILVPQDAVTRFFTSRRL